MHNGTFASDGGGNLAVNNGATKYCSCAKYKKKRTYNTLSCQCIGHTILRLSRRVKIQDPQSARPPCWLGLTRVIMGTVFQDADCHPQMFAVVKTDQGRKKRLHALQANSKQSQNRQKQSKITKTIQSKNHQKPMKTKHKNKAKQRILSLYSSLIGKQTIP